MGYFILAQNKGCLCQHSMYKHIYNRLCLTFVSDQTKVNHFDTSIKMCSVVKTICRHKWLKNNGYVYGWTTFLVSNDFFYLDIDIRDTKSM